MKYAPIQVLPDVPAGGVFAGIDWAVADHLACVAGWPGGSWTVSAPLMWHG